MASGCRAWINRARMPPISIEGPAWILQVTSSGQNRPSLIGCPLRGLPPERGAATLIRSLRSLIWPQVPQDRGPLVSQGTGRVRQAMAVQAGLLEDLNPVQREAVTHPG